MLYDLRMRIKFARIIQHTHTHDFRAIISSPSMEHTNFLAIQNLFWNMVEFDQVVIVGPRKLGKWDCYKFLFGKSQITHLLRKGVSQEYSQCNVGILPTSTCRFRLSKFLDELEYICD